MCELYVRSANHLYGFYNLVSLLLQSLLTFLGNSQHRCCTERVTGVHPEWIDIFNEADGNDVALCISYYFQLQLFPS